MAGSAMAASCAPTGTLGGWIGTIIFGAVIGILARLVLPGKQNMGLLITIILGVLGALIGYWLAGPFWGRGIATEAVRIVSDYAFATCNVLRLFALPFADNARSTRVLEKAGYTREAVLRSSSVKAGAPRDQALYALINPSWRGV